MVQSSDYLLDTDILIDVMKNHPSAVAFLLNASPPMYVSVMTCVEMWAGIRSKKEEKHLRRLLELFQPVEISTAIADTACQLSHQYYKSHGTGSVDCAIAATAIVEDLTLVTLNKKHFPMLKNKLVPYKKN